MRIVVTGKDGQVARSLMERGIDCGHEVIAVGRPQFDLAADPDDIARILEASDPEVIVSAAAYTAVDRAETEPELAFAVNEKGAASVARASLMLGVPLIHLSTDYVFDGAKATPYVEDDPPAPASVYGASKLAGERAVLSACHDATILRTAWVYSPFGANFVKTMLRVAGEREEIAVVSDQIGNPTSALDIGDGIIGVALKLLSSRGHRPEGIFHMTASGEATWADFAEAIFAQSATFGGPSARVKRITTEEYPTPARRPANSRLDCTTLQETYGVRLPDWRPSLNHVVERLIGRTTDRKVSRQ